MDRREADMPLRIRLLGMPAVSDGEERRPVQRGGKAWALLAFLLLASRPPTRAELAGLLCAEAEDPMGALRWQLAQLRRLLGPSCAVGGDPVVVSVPATAVVDVEVLTRGRWEEAIELPGLGRPLLEGVTVAGADPRLELWLDTERRRLTGLAAAVLHEAAMHALSLQRPERALVHARAAVDLQPMDEAAHAVLIQCLRACDDDAGADAHLVACSQLLQSGLDVPPGDLLLRARRGPLPPSVDGAPPSAEAMVHAGQVAVRAGATAQGVRTLREAVAMARRSGQDGVLASALLALGRALVSVGLGGEQEGGAILREALRLAGTAAEGPVAAAAARELAYADLDRGRYRLVHDRVAAAASVTGGDEAELAWLAAIDGAAWSDQGEYGRAEPLLRSAVAHADATDAHEAAVFARGFLGRLALLRGHLSTAQVVLAQAVDEAELHWVAMAAFPAALLAEVELGLGARDAAWSRAERAYVLGRQVDDPCLESIATRARGLVATAQGDLEVGFRLLSEAPRFSRRLPDSYLWIEAYALEALCAVAVELGAPGAAQWVADLEALAGRCGMRELTARALLHRARLGDQAAYRAGCELAASIDNPALHQMLSAAPS
jgi:DNA-binding SARP family transcriptional activator